MVNLQNLALLVSALDNGDNVKANQLAHLSRRDDSNVTAWVSAPGTAVPKPTDDSWYKFLTPDDVGGYSLGDIIDTRPVGGFSDNNNLTAYQVIYRSENSTGYPVGAMTTIVIPNKHDNSHVVVFPQPEDSSYINCASSYELLAGSLGPQIDFFLGQGYVVAVPDHEGFNSSFAAGILEGKLTLDSIRAIENSRNITGIQNNEYVVIGYSGGSIAAGWAAELQASYAPDLNVKGYSMGGYVASPAAVMKKVNKSPFVGFVPAAILGIASEYPQLWDLIGTEVTANATSELVKALSQCTEADILQFFNQDIFQYFSSGEGILDISPVKEIITNNTLGKVVPKPPMFIYNGIQDQIVPIESVDGVVEYYCDGGATVVYLRGEGKDHVGMAYAASLELFDWVGKAFKGNLTSGCTFEGPSPAFANSSSNGTSSTSGTSSINSTSSSNTNATTSSPNAEGTSSVVPNGSSGSGSGSGSGGSSAASSAGSGEASGSPTENSADTKIPNILSILVCIGIVLL